MGELSLEAPDQLELRESCGSVAGVELLRGRYFATQAPALVIHIVFSLGLGRTHDGHQTPPCDCAKTLIVSIAGTNGRLKVDDSITLLTKNSCGVQWLFSFLVVGLSKTHVGHLTSSGDNIFLLPMKLQGKTPTPPVTIASWHP